MSSHEKSSLGIFIHLDHESMLAFQSLSQEDIQTNHKNVLSPQEMGSVKAGASTGGAAGAADLQLKGLEKYGQNILKSLGYDTDQPSCTFYMQTPHPTGGTRQDLSSENIHASFEDAQDAIGKPIDDYDEMVDVLSRKETIKNRYRELLEKHHTVIDISHFYVSGALRGIVLDELSVEFPDIHDRVIQVTHFHSSPSYTIRDENRQYYFDHPHSWAREQYEIATLRNGITVFSTEKERQTTAQAYHGVQGITYNHIMENSFVAPLTIDTETVDNSDPVKNRRKAREILNIPIEATVFMMVSRLDTEKGYDLLIQNFVRWASEKLKNNPSYDLPYLAVIGGVPLKNPALLDRYNEIFKEIMSCDTQIQSRIRLPGPLSSQKIFPAADAIFGPSHTESYHMVPKEAGTHHIQTGDDIHGIPVFLSDISAHRETHGDTAYIMGGLEPEDFSSAFDRAMDPQERVILGRKNQLNSSRYSVEQTTRAFLEGLNTLLKKRGKSLF